MLLSALCKLLNIPKPISWGLSKCAKGLGQKGLIAPPQMHQFQPLLLSQIYWVLAWWGLGVGGVSHLCLSGTSTSQAVPPAPEIWVPAFWDLSTKFVSSNSPNFFLVSLSLGGVYRRESGLSAILPKICFTRLALGWHLENWILGGFPPSPKLIRLSHCV